MMSPLEKLKEQKREIIRRYAAPNDFQGLQQALTALGALTLLWLAVASLDGISHWLTAIDAIFIALTTVRLLALMHECGHASLFGTPWLNRSFGFVLGVIAGMPQGVWSKHHDAHHARNGDWETARGTLNILSVNEYAALTTTQQKRYRRARHPALAPVAGLMYLVLNPRMTWLRGSVALVNHVIRRKIARPGISIKAHAATFCGTYWQTPRDAAHMLWNNVALLSLWLVMSWVIGPWLFLSVHFASVSLAGAAYIVIFSVHHNFEHSYAVNAASLDHDAATLYGTSFVVLPAWLNWFTANVGYHHVHHLCPGIPNYAMVRCHNEYADLFSVVKRITPLQIPKTLKCLLWDTDAQRIISLVEYEARVQSGAAAGAFMLGPEGPESRSPRGLANESERRPG